MGLISSTARHAAYLEVMELLTEEVENASDLATVVCLNRIFFKVKEMAEAAAEGY